MHPIERLRYVARAQGADAESLVIETASALRGLGLDPGGLVVACRRIVERHPTSGPLWWLCCRLLTSTDPAAALRRVADEMSDDPTARHVRDGIADDAEVAVVGWPDVAAAALVSRGDVRTLVVDAGHGASAFVRHLDRVEIDNDLVAPEAAALAAARADLVLVECLALDADTAIVPVGSTPLAASASLVGTPVELVAGRGRRLPAAVTAAIVERAMAGDDVGRFEVETLPVTLAARIWGPDGPATGVSPECELAPELLRTSPM